MRTYVLAFMAALVAGLALASSASAASQNFANTTPINTPLGKGLGSPYPSAIQVQGMPGWVTDVAVRIPRFKLDYPADADILLVSPSGDTSIVMSDTCDQDGGVERSFVFSESVTRTAPRDRPCDAGFYRPTNEDQNFTDVWPQAPAGPHTADFTRFKGENPNGTWRLYVLDDLPGGKAAAALAQGWALTVTSEVPVATLNGGPADPYPLTRTVSNRLGVIRDVNVSLPRVLHDRPDDLDLLLVGPNGDKVELMSDACGSERAELSLAWDDESDRTISDGGPCGSVSYLPTDHEPDDFFSAPAPTGQAELSLSAFDGTNPNGDWKLYAYDDRPGDANGLFFQNFDLHFETRFAADVRWRTPRIDLLEGESGELKLVRDSGGDPVGPGAVTLEAKPVGATEGGDYEPLPKFVSFERGQREATVPVRTLVDELPEGTEELELTATYPTGDAHTPPDTNVAKIAIRDRPVPQGPGGEGPDEPGGGPNPDGGSAGPDGGPAGDRDAPETRIVKGPRRRTAGRSATFRFAADEPGSRFECRLDRGRFKPCRSGRRLTRLRAGKHSFVVRAIDPAGNADPSPAKRNWRIVR